MSFVSFNFLLFFPIVTAIYYIIPKKVRYIWLLFASYFFYMCWNAKYVLLILFSTVITYFCGLALSSCSNTRTRKILLSISMILNLSILFFFKYFDFAVESMAHVLSIFHITLHIPTFDVLLPVGISFYTFQALGYTFDVYRGTVRPERNFLRYALFVSFFPQLVAGPIERSKNLLKQLAEPARLDWYSFKEGILLMLWGFFLKIVIADRIADYVTIVYLGYNDFAGWYIVVATILFAFQVYCDFYGYSIIAMGAAKLLGIQLMENFHSPYLSLTVADFWRNWHISLTSWFRDYVYIPLGGSRKGKLRKYLNIMLVFLISGLWHGAKFSFIAWGGLNGLYQIIGNITAPIRKKVTSFLHIDTNTIGHKLLQGFLTFIMVDFSWIFFRANSFSEALVIVRQMLSVHNPWVLFDGSISNGIISQKNFYLLIMSLGILLFADICKLKDVKIRDVILRQNEFCQIVFFAFSVVFLLLFGKYGTAYNASQFIYFQF